MKKVKCFINCGCGHRNLLRLPKIFRKPCWREIRVDINPQVKPDIVTSTTDLSVFDDKTVDAIYSSHNLEHLYRHEVILALKEYIRVLKTQGFALITLPDIQQVARYIIERGIDEIIYHSPVGPVTTFDILFGHQASIVDGNHYMAHKSGFSARSLGRIMLEAGFSEVRVKSVNDGNLWALGFIHKQNTREEYDWFKRDII